MVMRVQATDLDGQPIGEIDLGRTDSGRATVNGQPVVAMRPIGGRIALIVGASQYCVPAVDYWQVIRAQGDEPSISRR